MLICISSYTICSPISCGYIPSDGAISYLPLRISFLHPTSFTMFLFFSPLPPDWPSVTCKVYAVVYLNRGQIGRFHYQEIGRFHCQDIDLHNGNLIWYSPRIPLAESDRRPQASLTLASLCIPHRQYGTEGMTQWRKGATCSLAGTRCLGGHIGICSLSPVDLHVASKLPLRSIRQSPASTPGV